MSLRHLLRLLAPLLLFAACSGHNHHDKQIFRYNESAGISTLDPAFAKDQSIIWPCRQLYNGLVELDSNCNVQPSIAKSWIISPDGLTYTFTLRSDVCFHRNPLFLTPDSTRTVVASDFVYSLRRIIDPSVASPGAWVLADLDTTFAPDDTTLVIRLKQPFAPFLSLLSMVYCSVVPHEVVQHYGKDFRNHPCGTGPFQFQYWKEGVKLVFRRNPLYFEFDTLSSTPQRLPYLDAVSVTFIIDRQTAFLEFIKGNLDFLNSIDPSYKDELLNADGTLKDKYASRIDLHSTPYLNTEYLGFNMENSDAGNPTSDLRIRQAINLAFDRNKMMRYLRNNIGTPGTGGIVPIGLPGFDTLPAYGYQYDPQRARQLLAQAGYHDGQGLPPITLSTTANYLDLCKYIQQQLALIGMNIQVDVNPPAPLRQQIAQGRTPWFRASWVADYPDPENYLSLFYSPNHSPAGPNYTRFTSPQFDKLYQQARRNPDPNQRIQLYRQMDSIVMQQAPVVVLYYDQILHFTHKNIHGLRTNAINTLDLRRVTTH